MAYKSKILLGKIIKLSGYEGAVAVKLEKIFTENIPQMESIFLEIEGKLVPFFISGTAINKNKVGPENLIGYSIFVEEDKLLGSISEVMTNSEQWLINVISIKKKNILIPFHEDFIVSLDKRKKVIIMNCLLYTSDAADEEDSVDL